MDSPRRTFQSSGWTFQVELDELYRNASFAFPQNFSKVPKNLKNPEKNSKNIVVFRKTCRDSPRNTFQCGEATSQIELDELYRMDTSLTHFDTSFHHWPPTQPKNLVGFAKTCRDSLRNTFQRSETTFQIELDELYLECSTATLESIPGRIHPENTRILTQDILRVLISNVDRYLCRGKRVWRTKASRENTAKSIQA